MGKVKSSGRISFATNEGNQEITILPPNNPKALKQLKIWLIMWTTLGVAMLFGFMLAKSSAEIAFIVIYMAFWFFFEMKVFRAFQFRSKGRERWIFKEDHLVYIREIGKRGLPRMIPYDAIEEIKLTKQDETGFLANLNRSAFMVAGEGVEVKTSKITILTGVQCDKNESEKLKSLLVKVLKNK